MTVQARHCNLCQGIFLPVVEQEESLTQCPHCSAQMPVGECAPAEVPQFMPEQEYRQVDEAEEFRRRRALRHEKWARRLAWTGGICAAVLAGFIVRQFNRGGREHSQKQSAEVAALTKAELMAQQERTAIENTARRVLAAKTLDELLPVVAGAAQVKELITWSINRHPFSPEFLSKIDSIETLDSEGLILRRLCVSTTNRPVVWMVMTREEGEWKLNWELYSNAHAERWRALLREAPGTSAELPLLVVKKPAPDAYILRAGESRETHDAVILCAGDRADLACALLPRTSPLWKELPDISFEDAEKVIARVTLQNPGDDPPLIRLDGIVQRGWLRGTQLPVAKKASPP